MFEVLIREAAARFGVGDKALPLLQMLLAAMTAKDTGGVAGFLEKFKAAGLGPLVQSWLGGGEGAQPISNSQVETVLGASGGLLPALTAQTDLPRDKITAAIGYLLPTLIGRLTPGGILSATPPAEVASYAQAGQNLFAQAAQSARTAHTAGIVRKWLIGAVVIIVVLAALYAWRASGHKTPETIPVPAISNTSSPARANTQPPIPGAAFGGSVPALPASEAASAAAPETSAASAAN